MLIRIIIFLFTPVFAFSQNTYSLAVLKYNGGGDWYANPTALPNLIDFSNQNIGTNIKKIPEIVDVGSIEIYNYPLIHMTGHGNIIFNFEEAENLRKYLIAGGFLHVDDNYGMDEFFRREIKKVFPELDFVELPTDHPIYSEIFDFQYKLIPSLGATETYPFIGSSEIITDITSTGKTLADNNLRVLKDGLILSSRACLFVAKKKAAKLQPFLKSLGR